MDLTELMDFIDRFLFEEEVNGKPKKKVFCFKKGSQKISVEIKDPRSIRMSAV